MDPNTGEIRAFDEMTSEERKRFTVPIPDDLLEEVKAMDTAERKKWAVQQTVASAMARARRKTKRKAQRAARKKSRR